MENKALEFWKKTIGFIRDNIQATQYETWFAPIRFSSFTDGELTIIVPSQFFCEFLEEHYYDIMKKAIDLFFGEETSLRYKWGVADTEVNIGASENPSNQHPITNGHAPSRPTQEFNSQLNPKYNFDNFIEGSCNKLTRTIGLAVAEDPSHTPFNPLFIYGTSGVGKTHLINAIGGEIKQRHPEKRVLYVSAHLFMVQYTDSVRNNTLNDFINFYQSIDVLIIDDIQELSGLIKTQNTFFHIFNHLHQNGHQLILTADRTPVEMKGFEERMLTRFKWGMLAELEKPNQDLRKAIVLKKIKRDGLRIPADVVEFIANNVNNSVRDLEGIINSLMAYSVVYNCEINMELAQRVVGRVVHFEKKEINVNEILKHTCEVFRVSQNDLLSRSRKRPIAIARQVAMYLAQKHTDMALNRIGTEIGHRDHATVLHSIRQVTQQLTIDSKLSAQVNEIEVILKQA